MAIYMMREYVPRTFTISRTEQSNMSSGWTYSDDATWLTAGDTAFDEFFGYYGCRLNTSGVETDKITQEESWWAWKLDITQLGTLTSGDNVMIAFPVRWIKMSKSWSTVTLSITEELGKDWYQYYAHSTWTLSNPWTPQDVFYLGAYEWCVNSSALKSWSGQTAYTNWRQSQNCYYAKNNGSWYNIIGFYQRQYINALYIMKYGNPNSQNVVWMWYVNWSGKVNTWWTNSQTDATYWTSSNTTQCKLFWLEDRWGNISEWIWWVYTNNGYVLYSQLSWWSWALSWWETTWTTLPQISSYYNLSSIAGNNKAMFAPTGTVRNSSYNTYYSDYASVNASRLAMVGGARGAGNWGWAFYCDIWYWNNVDYYDNSTGSRLMYLNWLT